MKNKTDKYHTRKEYEKLLQRLLIEGDRTTNINHLSDYQLLCAINRELIRFDLIPMEQEELEIELH